MDYLGSVFGSTGDLENAITCHKKALEINPNDAVVYMNLGMAYGSKGEIEDALNAFNKASEINPDDTVPHLNLGNLFFQIGDFSMALISYTRAVELKNGLKYAPNDLNNALSMLKKLESE